VLTGRRVIGRGVRERRLSAVPGPVRLALIGGLLAQLSWHGLRPAPTAVASALPAPPSLAALRLASLGDAPVAARLLSLWLQAFDYQPGISIPFRNLDYGRVTAWLGRLLELDPRTQYPLLAASRQYAEVQDQARQRQMLEFVYQQFMIDPEHRWPWLAHAAIVAKHRLKDLPLALRYARAVTEKAVGPGVPAWARDMTIVVLEDMGELESARLLVGGLLASGQIKDPHEVRFLNRKLEELARKADEIPTGR
jgi:hypothetical protein